MLHTTLTFIWTFGPFDIFRDILSFGHVLSRCYELIVINELVAY